MRVAFFVLLLANLVFMAWAGWIDAPPPPRTSDANARLPKLKLVSEASAARQGGQSGGTVRKMGLAAAPGGEEAPVPAAPTRCVSVGPFNDLDIAAKAAGALQARGFMPQQRAAEGATWDGYWVYIGGVADATTADRIFKTLDRSGIRDARLMPEANDGRRISVGLFSERARAERRAKAIQQLGFRAEVEERSQPGTVYWVDLTLEPSDGAVPVQDLLAADSDNSRLSVQSCPPHPAVEPAASPDTPPAEPTPSGSSVPPTTVAGAPKYSDRVR